MNANGTDLLAVGGPTHVHGLTTKRSRAAAVNGAHTQIAKSATERAVGHAEQGLEPGLRDWLKRLEHSTGVSAAAFDTRLHGHRLLTGSACAGSRGGYGDTAIE